MVCSLAGFDEEGCPLPDFCAPADGPGCPPQKYNSDGCLEDTFTPYNPDTQLSCPGFSDDTVSIS